MATDKKETEPIKVTDRRLFTPDGEIREEYQQEIRPREGAPSPERQADPPAATQPQPEPQPADPPSEDSPRKRGENPGTPFAMFIEQLVVQAYMSLGLLRSPYGDVPVEPAAARQMIDILGMLAEKTEGNLSVEESEFLQVHLSELKLAWVRQSKSI